MFTKQQSLRDFMKSNNVLTAQIVRNPKTGKRFCTFGEIKTRISENVDKLSADLQVCWFTPEGADPSWIVCKSSDVNVEDTFEL